MQPIHAIVWGNWAVSGLALLLYEGGPKYGQVNWEYVFQLEGYGESKAGYSTSSITPHKLMIQLSWKASPET
jgi:hypothetical protein